MYGISREEEDTHFPTNMINPELEIREENFFLGGRVSIRKKELTLMHILGHKILLERLAHTQRT